MDGKLVQSGNLQADTNLLSIPVKGGIQSGSYLLRMNSGEQQLAKIIIIQ